MSTRTLWKIKVDVHQVYNLLLPDSTELPDPYIAASLEMPRASRLGDSATSSAVQRTASKTKMSSGTFNSVMLFIANIFDFDFAKIKILIRVHNGKKLVQMFESDGELLGTTSFSLSKVYSQPKHWIPREWLPITSPTAPGDCRGYVLVSIGVFGPGDDVPSQLSEFQLNSDSGKDASASRSILDKIVQTPETSFHHCMLIFNVLRAENLPVLGSAGDLVVPSSGYIRVSFVGIQAYTRTVASNANPAWNESIRIPVLYPSWDQYVLVEVFSRVASAKPGVSTYVAPSSVTSGNSSVGDILLGSAIFDFDLLYKSGIQPTWFNLYTAAGSRNPAFAHLYGSEYGGRVQVSANVARSSELTASIVPFDNSAGREPVTEEIVLFVDVYELSFMDDAVSRVPAEIWIQIQVGPNTFESDHIFQADMTCVVGDELGRLAPVRIHLPVDRAMAYEMVVSLMGLDRGERSRMGFARVPVDRFITHSAESADPEWLKMCTIRAVVSSSFESFVGDIAAAFRKASSFEESSSADDSLVAVANVLASITAFRLSGTAFAGGSFLPNRPARIPYDMQPYELRFHMHQACNLPIADMRGQTNSFARVTLAGVSAKTAMVPSSLYPVWNEALTIAVDLPRNPSLRPDVLIEVVDKTRMTTLGFATMKTSVMKPVSSGPPTWLKLSNSTNSLGVHQDAFVLCAATLVVPPVDEKFSKSAPPDGQPVSSNSALPARATFTVDLLIVGVRLLRNYSIENLNRIEVCWGRQRGALSKRIVTIQTTDPIAGEGGQFNFCQPALLDLDLPVESVFQEFLEIRLLEQVKGREEDGAWGWGSAPVAATERAIGFGYLHLNPCYAWISDSGRDLYRDLFRLKTHEELRQAEEAAAAAVAAAGDEADLKTALRKRRKKTVVRKNVNRDELEMEYIENEIDAAFGIDPKSSNYLALPIQCFNAVDTEKFFSDRFKYAAKAAQRRKSTVSALRSRAGEMTQGSRFISDFVWEPTITREKQDNTRRELETDLEKELDRDLLPYISVPLVTGSETGSESFQVVGYLKARCKVREKSTDSSEILELQQSFVRNYDDCARLVCRLYVLRAEGIVPSQAMETGEMGVSDSSSSAYYLWVRNVCGDLIAEYPTCSIKDDGAVSMEGGVNPEFNKCFQLPCSFPENSVLHIELYERKSTVYAASGLTGAISTSSDILIGSVMIDIENRWFHPEFQDLLSLDSLRSEIPIESWTVRSADSAGIPKGKLKLWVELMDQVTSMGRAIETLPSPQPESLQVRLVLWRTRSIPNPDGEDQCHQGVTLFMQSLDPQHSDTHYGSLDGTGTFNWRFVLNPVVPSDDASVRIQLQHRPLVGLGGQTPIGEVTLDFSQELAAVRRTRRGIDLGRSWVPLSHPAYIGKLRGMVEIQVRILTVEEARSFPVGVGREEPNQDPFLDGEDPHLVQHRNALANTVVGRSLGKFIDAMKSGLKWATILFIIGWVISGIVGLVFLLVSMGIIKLGD